MDWLPITRAEWLATISAVIAMLSASYTWRNYRISARKERRELDSKKPVFETPSCALDRRYPGWAAVRLVVRNRFDHRLFVTGVKLLAPKAGEIGIGTYRANKPALEHFEGRWFQPMTHDEPIQRDSVEGSTRAINFHLKALEAETIYSVQLELEERLDETRRSTKTVKIKVPALKTSAPSATQSARDT